MYKNNFTIGWWSQFQNIPYPNTLAVLVSSSLRGYDEEGRAMRRTIMRYACLSLTLVFRVLSPRVKSRFPKLKDLVKFGLLLDEELYMLEELEEKFPGYSKSWLPVIWAANIVSRARKEGRIRNDFSADGIVKQLNIFRSQCTKLMSYHSIQIPLVYVQVVTIVVYFYFFTALFANQEIRRTESDPVGFNTFDAHPIILILEFIFYMGWLKVAEALLNPFGMDDDDFDVNSMIDRNLQMSYLIIDDMHNEHPELLKDLYWNGIPQILPDRTKILFPEPEELDADIIDYDVLSRKSVFGRVSVTMKKYKKSNLEDKNERRVTFANDCSLIPNPNHICDIYQNNPKVQTEQNALNQEFEKQRRLSKQDAENYLNSKHDNQN
ncbi:bestrophin-3-like [Chironomus tepperi]|uniref:bestrophin-3-like n=1 Tax=Chironomus tepperi TaxID=113505 RepID=UPI00391F724A